MTKHILIAAAVFCSSLSGFAQPSKAPASSQTKDILIDTKLLNAVGIAPLRSDSVTGTSIARISPSNEIAISQKAHEWNRCGGFEVLSENALLTDEEQSQALGQLRQAWNNMQKQSIAAKSRMTINPTVQEAISQVDENNLKAWVSWFSAFPSRFNKSATANVHVTALKTKIEEMLQSSSVPATVDLISHTSTPQKSIRIRLEGAKRPNEIVVLGAHMDSINIMDLYSSGNYLSPGSDDNASGSANLLEALRILMKQKQLERSLEIMLYAGEESGLLGSAEIAKSYKQAKKEVVAVLQLDMTLQPGDGEFVLGSMTDFTSPWLRTLLAEINATYIHARIVDDQCGYACSDHASWFRQGYPTLMPFESTFDSSNQDIHSEQDKITPKSNFKHSAIFSKFAIALALELGNSSSRQP